jgi:transposase
VTVYVLNPRDVKKYAEGVGRRGKTDRLDAEVIARYVAREHEELHAYAPRSAAAQRLEQLLKRRGKLVSAQVGLSQTWHGVPGVKRELAAVAGAYTRLLARVDRLVEETISELPEIQAYAKRIGTIPGYGELGSVALAHALLWLPFTRADAFIAHTGLDPRPCDSGEKHGRRRLSKRGPAALRTILHMCAMSASQTKTWRPYYQRQLAKGLSG